jgi:hypothetical protein
MYNLKGTKDRALLAHKEAKDFQPGHFELPLKSYIDFHYAKTK